VKCINSITTDFLLKLLISIFINEKIYYLLFFIF
jgi:hypothetical protein